MLAAGAASVTTVAYEVVCGSPTQLSRKDARKFGRPAAQPKQGKQPSKGPEVAPEAAVH